MNDTLRDRLNWLLWAALLVAVMAALLLYSGGCTAKSVEYTTQDGHQVRISSIGFLAGHQLQAGEYRSSPTTRSVKIEGYGQDTEAAKVLGEAVIQALKKAP